MKEQDFQTWLSQLPLIDEACGYFDEKTASFYGFNTEADVHPSEQEIFMNQGFRRAGRIFYRNECPSCQMCRSIRLDINDFKLTRSQKKIIRRNQDLKVVFDTPKADAEKELLYLRYQFMRHQDQNQEFQPAQKIATMKRQMYNNPENTRELNLYLNNRLCGFGILDLGTESVSAVYSVFDPELERRSLGSFFILTTLQWAKQQGFRYYHLGYFIEGHPKMNYKKKYTPYQLRNPQDGSWMPAN